MTMATDKDKKRIAVALGDFDGMHRAHRVVVTGAGDAIIYCVNNRFSLLQRSIFERRYPRARFADFKQLKDKSASEFVDRVLLGELGAGIILCGYNFRLGKGAMWSAMDLRRYLESRDVWVRILEQVDYDGSAISSTRIRTALANGDIMSANNMLGYNFTFENTVLHGDRRGATIGFPTVNQHLPEGLTVPKYGVYESRTFVDGKAYKSFTNIGIRPTWKVDNTLCETHIFDFDGNLYGRTVRVELLRYIREERAFPSAEELRKQLTYDKSSII